MTTSAMPTTPHYFDVAEIDEDDLAYFRARLRERWHELLVSEFLEERGRSGITRAALAERIGRQPEQVTRWLKAPGNWTLDTISDLFLALGAEPQVGAVYISTLPVQNMRGPAWLEPESSHAEGGAVALAAPATLRYSAEPINPDNVSGSQEASFGAPSELHHG